MIQFLAIGFIYLETTMRALQSCSRSIGGPIQLLSIRLDKRSKYVQKRKDATSYDRYADIDLAQVACTEAFSLLIDSNVNDAGSIASQCTDDGYISPQVSDITINTDNLELQDDRPVFTVPDLHAHSFFGPTWSDASNYLSSNIYARYDAGQQISELEVVYTSSGLVELRVIESYFNSDDTPFTQSWWDSNSLSTGKKMKVCAQNNYYTDEQCTQEFSFILDLLDCTKID